MSKNHQGGIADSSEGKVVTIVHSEMARSHVMLLDFYLSKIPPAAKQPDGKLLNGKNMMADASINGKKYTNHRLHATGATTLFDIGVPEAIIQKCSGHCSTKALRMYERVTPDQDLDHPKYCTTQMVILLRTLNAKMKMSLIQIPIYRVYLLMIHNYVHGSQPRIGLVWNIKPTWLLAWLCIELLVISSPSLLIGSY